MKKQTQQKIKQQLNITNDRGPTFTGNRPAVIENKKQKERTRAALKRKLPKAGTNCTSQDFSEMDY